MNPPGRVALVGFMGSGKSTVGRILAARMDYRFMESDDEVEARAQASVSEIFRQRGESYFRELEQQVIRDLLGETGRVIATGGGAFVQPACAEDLLARSFTVYLRCDFAEASRRVAGLGGRPLVESGEAALARLYEERKDKYAQAHATVETTHRAPNEVASDVLRLLPLS